MKQNRSEVSIAFAALAALAIHACTGRSGPAHPEPVRSVAAPGLTPVGTAAADAGPDLDAADAADAQVGRTWEALARGTGTQADRALGEGDEAYLAERWLEAARAYERARELAPSDPAPLVGKVRVAIAEAGVPTDHAGAPGHPVLKKAVETLRRAIRLDASYGPAHLEFGRALLVLGQAADAVASLREAARLLSGNPEAHSALGVALLATGKAKEAVESLRKAAKLDPDSVARQTNLGTALLLRGRVHRAVRVFERAVTLAPDDGRIRTDLGTAYLLMQDVQRALPHLRKAVEIDPDRATFRSNLGYALQMQKKHDAAIEQYRKAVEIDPDLGSAWINLGTALAQTGKRAKARKAFERAIEIDPTDPRPPANLEELEQMGDAGTP